MTGAEKTAAFLRSATGGTNEKQRWYLIIVSMKSPA
jgi:hypothetical protein